MTKNPPLRHPRLHAAFGTRAEWIAVDGETLLGTEPDRSRRAVPVKQHPAAGGRGMSVQIHHGDCLDVLRGMDADSVDAVVTDPPYFKVKDEPWDRQWDKPAAFLAWLDTVLEQVQRVLKPNGSLYLFASPRMAARVECLIAERFNVLNRIRWIKDSGWHKKADKDEVRSFLSPWEEIIFAEHYGADSMALGESGYAAQCEQLRGFVFEPLRKYLADEWARAGLTARDANVATDSQMAGHYLTRTQWALPTREKYEQLRAYANRKPGEYLRRDYEELRRDYEELRRPFQVTADVPYTDVWEFPTVATYPGKHVCEKPVALLEHIISCSTRPGAVVLDCFAGSGATGAACINLGREFIGIEKCERWARRARLRLEHWQPNRPQQARARVTETLPLFAEAAS